MASASSVFIVSTIVFASLAPCHAHRIKDASAAPELVDLHVLMANSPNFRREGLQHFGKCCCDKHGIGMKGAMDYVKGGIDVIKGYTGEIRSNKCAILSVTACGEVTPGERGGDWATANLHSYTDTEDGKCEVPKNDLSELITYFSKKDALPGTVLFDLHFELLNSKTFHLEGLRRFGKCCCDKDKEIVRGLDFHDTTHDLLNKHSMNRSGQCGIFSVETCGEVGYNGVKKTVNAVWANRNLHDYTNTKNGNICSLSFDELKPITKDFEEKDKLVLYDAESVMSSEFQETKFRCCCDKMSTAASTKFAALKATSGRCGLFDDVTRCGAKEAEWNMESMHHYTKVEGTKCTLTKDYITTYFSDKKGESVESHLKKADAIANASKYIDVHVALMNSKTFQLDQDFSYFQARFGRCCCDQDAKGSSYGALTDVKSKLFAKKGERQERTGTCELQPFTKCGALRNGKRDSHEWRKAGGKCVILKTEFQKIQAYYDEQDKLVMHDLHTVMAKTDTFKDGSFTTQSESFKTEFGRCCCDKPVTDINTKKLWEQKPFTSGRCGLFKKIASCGEVETEVTRHNSKEIWGRDFGALNQMHEYVKVEGGKCALTKKQLQPLLDKYAIDGEGL
jgi:hypothetical protein